MLFSKCPELGVLAVEQFRAGELVIVYQFIHNILTNSLSSNPCGRTVVGDRVINGIQLDGRLVVVVFHAPIIQDVAPYCNPLLLFILFFWLS